ncbi:WD40 repeat domain-containing protein [Tuwongella immobilis]|uniref:Uncharacterized protein n=1 Tax=Tuwongella immobilis TaxID=692036 RepID=A0A6C2YJP5_9BACT|nr:WD40 repeat domain-containing protein [Tuwongella immobilis]VIP01636.1 wd40 repeat-containing protein : WD40 repeat-containing protein OS=Singulisphaera acidiphila (strain ATCC BAA-1392 / DSM 18658 / VKM B-2454 / MOB10) GN=Sinac_1517 PE=4 SV=1: WD40: WD40: WD40 [Tuwongella immobilis]VTR98996.1 wd40 repeat-containing protein : WD40 repeat-containing protein OS=Singulisphaera acidiphila (strain ATCC BAA-1392 / DSM 18658 / VKM B-2454 / MOB10) GN=Sinac_1517 PE=4 SV=1: WD40: WD40: WD40 [Tuwongella 
MRALFLAGLAMLALAIPAVPAPQPLAPPNAPPNAPAKVPAAPITALAYRPDGGLLLVGTYGRILAVDPQSGRVLGHLAGLPQQVTAILFHPKGQSVAIACGEPGQRGELRFIDLPAPSATGTIETMLATTTRWTLPAAHRDRIPAIAFTPDGQLLATASYDRRIQLWDTASGKLIRTLTDHSDSVYDVAIDPTGKWLASVSADRAVKVWEIATGNRLYTLSDATDWLYAVRWTADGKRLVAAGVDRSLRIWEANGDGAKLVRSAFAHQGAVLQLLMGQSDASLFTVGEDKVIKRWSESTLAEQAVFAPRSDSVQSLALRPDGHQLAVGRFDGGLQLLAAADGKAEQTVLPVLAPKPATQPAPKPAPQAATQPVGASATASHTASPKAEKPPLPMVESVTPTRMTRGQTQRFNLTGKHLQQLTGVTASLPGIVATLEPLDGPPTQRILRVQIPATVEPGTVTLTLKATSGPVKPISLLVDRFPGRQEVGLRDSALTLPVSIHGEIARAGEVDAFAITLAAGQQVGVQLQHDASATFDPVLEWGTASGQRLGEGMGGLMAIRAPQAGDYRIWVRDRQYRGPGQYRLHLGPIPIVTGIFPRGGQAGTTRTVQLIGVNLPQESLPVAIPATAKIGGDLPVTLPPGILGQAKLRIGHVPEVHAPGMLPVPGVGNGRLDGIPAQIWKFPAKKGQRLILETHAARIGSPVDTIIDMLDESGQLLERATLRCQAKTTVAFRPHDSKKPGIRLDTWNELAMQDFIYINGELMKIDNLPANPDADCMFESVNNERRAYLGTSPRYHAAAEAVYKVSIHPPGSTFPPNGMPVFHLPVRNDDGGPGFGSDSMLEFDPPRDAVYQVRVRAADGVVNASMGAIASYRLTVRPPQPDFTVRFTPNAPAVWKGNGLPIGVQVERHDGFAEAISVELVDLPPGFRSQAGRVDADKWSSAITLFADAQATAPKPDSKPIRLIARAMVNGQEWVREFVGGVPTLRDPGDLQTRTVESAVEIRPGQETKLTVQIDRLGDFKGRVPLEVRGLPYGVRVMNIGLNGILVLPGQTSREVVLYAEPWVKPTSQPMVILSRSERKGTEHAAKPVLLRVVGP